MPCPDVHPDVPKAPRASKLKAQKHIHYFVLPSTGARVEGICWLCGAVRVCENTFSGAIAYKFGSGGGEHKSSIKDNLVAQGRAAREMVINEEMPLAEMAKHWQKGGG